MRILFVNYEYPPLGGGGGVATRDIAVRLAKRHEVHVLTSGAADLPAEEVVEGVRIFRAPVWGRKARSHASFLSMITFWPIGTRHGLPLVRSNHYDVINTWFAVPSGPTGVHLARAGNVPHVITLAGGDVYDPSKWYTPDKNPLLARVVKWVLRSADARIAVSKDLARRCKEIYRPEGEVEVISLGMNPPPLVPPRPRAELGLDEDAVYLITIGRLVRRKNLALLLEALAGLDRPDIHFLVLGDGPERPALERLAAERGIADRIHFKGFVSEEEKYRLLAAADIFTLPSQHEAFGLVYLEGMHAGLPVIAARPGGQEDFLVDGETGALVDRHDIDGLRQAILRLADDPAGRVAMGRHAREVASRFTADVTAEKYERLFERVIGERQG